MLKCLLSDRLNRQLRSLAAFYCTNNLQHSSRNSPWHRSAACGCRRTCCWRAHRAGEEWVSMPSEVLPEEVMNRLAEPKAEWHKAH